MSKGKTQNSIAKLEAHAAKLSSMVDYQAGSVVSRTLIDKEAGTVTLFAFDEGQGLSDHTAPFDALLYILEGEAEVIVAGKQVNLDAGEITLLSVGKVHSVKAVSRFKMMLIMIRS